MSTKRRRDHVVFIIGLDLGIVKENIFFLASHYIFIMDLKHTNVIKGVVFIAYHSKIFMTLADLLIYFN